MPAQHMKGSGRARGDVPQISPSTVKVGKPPRWPAARHDGGVLCTPEPRQRSSAAVRYVALTADRDGSDRAGDHATGVTQGRPIKFSPQGVWNNLAEDSASDNSTGTGTKSALLATVVRPSSESIKAAASGEKPCSCHRTSALVQAFHAP